MVRRSRHIKKRKNLQNFTHSAKPSETKVDLTNSVDVSTQTSEFFFKQFNPIHAPDESMLEILIFLDANETEKCQLVCKKWNRCIDSNRSRLPTGLPQAVDFDSDGKISYTTKRQSLPRNKISKLSLYLTADMLTKFEKNTKCQLVKIRVKFLYVYIWEASRIALLPDFFKCFMVDYATISLSAPETDFLIKRPKFVPIVEAPAKLTITLRNKTQTGCSVEEILDFVMYPNFPNLNRHALELQYLDQEKSMTLIEKIFELFQQNEDIGRYFQRFDFQTLEWANINRVQAFADAAQMEKTIIADGENEGFLFVRYNVTRADNWIFQLEITDDDVSVYVKPNNN